MHKRQCTRSGAYYQSLLSGHTVSAAVIERSLPTDLSAEICATATLYRACRYIEHAREILDCLVDVFNATDYLDRNCVHATGICGSTLRQAGICINDIPICGSETFRQFRARLATQNYARNFRLQYFDARFEGLYEPELLWFL